MPIAGVPALNPRRLPLSIADGELVPAWLGDRDRPWLRDLLEVAAGYVGRRVHEWLRRSRETEIDPRAGARQAVALHVLDAWLAKAAAAPARSALRLQLYRSAVAGDAAENQEERAGMFDDLPLQRFVRWPEPAPEPTRLALAANSTMAQSLLRHATEVRLSMFGASRALLRTAWLHGAALQPVCGDAGDVVTRWRRDAGTRLPRALAAIVPLLPWARRYRLEAVCDLGHARGVFVAATGDPLLPGDEPRRYDSRLERWFVQDLLRAAPECRVVREPAPIVTSCGLAFPDFAVEAPSREPWLCEIAGLRDPAALPAKLALLEHPRLLLCLPERAVPAAWRGHPRVVGYGRRVPAADVLARLR